MIFLKEHPISKWFFTRIENNVVPAAWRSKSGQNDALVSNNRDNNAEETMNGVLKTRSAHQVLPFSEEIKLFEDMYRAQNTHVYLAFTGRGDYRIHPRMIKFVKTWDEWKNMDKPARAEDLKQFYTGLPTKRTRIVLKGGRFSVPADLSRVSGKIGQVRCSKTTKYANRCPNNNPKPTKKKGPSS